MHHYRRRNPGLAQRRGVTAADVDPRELRVGTEHELEHTSDRRRARQIALDHLAEDPRYYEHLEACERRFSTNAEEMSAAEAADLPIGSIVRAGPDSYIAIVPDGAVPVAILPERAGSWLPPGEPIEQWGDSFLLVHLGRGRVPTHATAQRHAMAFHGQHQRNGSRYYVWALAKGSNEPLASEGPWGPYPLPNAKYFARIGATEGVHDRIVTRGLDGEDFEVLRRYRAGSGERVI